MVTTSEMIAAIGAVGIIWVCTIIGAYFLGKNVGRDETLDQIQDSPTVNILRSNGGYGLNVGAVYEYDAVSPYPPEVIEGYEDGPVIGYVNGSRKATDTDWRHAYQALAPDDAETLQSFRQWTRRMHLFISTIARDVLSDPVEDDSDIDVWPESEYPSPGYIPVPEWALNTGELPAIVATQWRDNAELATREQFTTDSQ